MGTLTAFAVILASCFAAAWRMAKRYPHDDIHWHMEARRLAREGCRCPCHGERG